MTASPPEAGNAVTVGIISPEAFQREAGSSLMMTSCKSPFGGNAVQICSLHTTQISEMYRRKCGIDVYQHFHGLEEVQLYECPKTGYRFWRPAEIAGSEAFYRQLSASWPSYYYRTTRWEYGPAREFVNTSSEVLEIGCGRGFFLSSLEGHVRRGIGIELNRDAIAHKVTSFEITAEAIETVSARCPEKFDAVFSFQVLEHVVDPSIFIDTCIACLKPGGILALSTPNNTYVPHASQEDAFDLPPHHMGHFTPEVYERIAALKGLSIELMVQQPRSFSVEAVTPRTEQRLLYRIARRMTRAAMDAVYRLSAEPGPNMLTVLRKAG